MTQYQQQRLAGVGKERWIQIGTTSGLGGGVLLALIGIAIHGGLTDAQFAVVNPLGAVAMGLLALALPALYLTERHWFGTLASVGYGLMSAGWLVATVALGLFAAGSMIAGLVFPLALLVALIGALAVGGSMLRTDADTVSRLGAWLLVAAIPVGLPLSIAVSWYVLGQVDTPWNGPLVLYALAWVAFCAQLRTRKSGGSVPETPPQ